MLGITFEVGHLGWGCFWESTMRAIFQTVGNLWMFESHMDTLKCLEIRWGVQMKMREFLINTLVPPLNPLFSPSIASFYTYPYKPISLITSSPHAHNVN